MVYNQRICMPAVHRCVARGLGALVLFAAGLEPSTNSQSEMRHIIEADYRKWGQFIQTTGLKTE